MPLWALSMYLKLQSWPTKRRRPVRATKGFTLIEVLVVVIVIAVLAAVALPSYQSSIRKARRTDARGALTTVGQMLERYNTQNNTYVGATLGTGAGALYPAVSENGHYTISLSNVTTNTFTATATPAGGQAADSCGTYTVNQAAVRAPTALGCW
jgi:type IV pilus assembly protein PilE